ncbi:MAG: precorrin-6y C5,15-methyltransferase (decarboxylating) subunit CbiE [Candidatus Rokubacteria bacterium]|nr:precorrin-6y C5,15-methyltransferase (decarboxylating) subunit CbiE [Candidatus Rokubacteria bacterium]
MTKPWLTVIGMGEEGLDGLGRASRSAIEEAEVLIGSERLLAMVPQGSARRVPWPRPFDAAAAIDPYRGRKVVVLATGDPLHYGVGRTILGSHPGANVRIEPYPSAFSLAAARLGWPLEEVETISLHARNAALIEPLIAPGVRIIALTEGDATIREAARRLQRRGYGGSPMTVLAHMGGELEQRLSFPAEAIPETRLSALSTLAVECLAEAQAPLLPRVPGLPDEAFLNDGQITKSEVRAITLSGLAPFPGALLWDVGAGCGSVAIEWMRAARGARAIAFERDEQRADLIAENAGMLGVPGLQVVRGAAPASFSGMPSPDAVFLGGGLTDPAIFEAAWAALKPGGRLLANAVTLEGEAHLGMLQSRHGGEILRIDISQLEALGPYRTMRPRLPVTQWRAVKP